MSSFAGRVSHLDEVETLLGDGRLLTLTGPAGCGKSRLALEAARRLAGNYANGACYVDVGGVEADRDLPSALATALDLAPDPSRGSSRALIDRLGDQELLIVLDNCGHLISACAWLVDELLRGCPRLVVIATSREVLRVPGEVVYSVPPMDVPPPGLSLDDLDAWESVQLFTGRARAVNPRLDLQDTDAEAITQLVRRLDGVPLAIELAASASRTFTPGQIVELLDDRFALLTEGPRTGPERQQTLLATVDWSYDHLTGDEREMFDELALFPADFDLAAASAVHGEPRLVPALLRALVDKSMVTTKETGLATPRYGMLETLREYGAGKLTTRPDVDTIRQRYVEFYGRLAQELEQDLLDPAKTRGPLRLFASSGQTCGGRSGTRRRRPQRTRCCNSPALLLCSGAAPASGRRAATGCGAPSIR